MKILLTNYWMRFFSGSETATLELYELFSKLGHEVELFTNVLSKEIENHLQKRNVTYYTPESFEVREEYDLVWVHQQTIPLVFFERNPLVGRWIFHHMSPFEPLEFTINAEIENSLAAYVLANSMETELKLRSLGIVDTKLRVLGNPAPDSFFNFPDDQKSNSYFLFISNHPPAEILGAMKILSLKGSRIVHIGMGSEWAKSRIVTPEDIAGASVVVSIGKSIQYSIAMQKTFFIYDQFGGDGFVYSKENFYENSFFNFSGRNCRKIQSVDAIVSDLLNFQSNNPYVLDYISLEDILSYSLTIKIKNLIHELDFSRKSHFLDTLEPRQMEVYRATIEVISRFIREFSRVDDAQKLITNSLSWRVTAPLRRIKSLIKG